MKKVYQVTINTVFLVSDPQAVVKEFFRGYTSPELEVRFKGEIGEVVFVPSKDKGCNDLMDIVIAINADTDEIDTAMDYIKNEYPDKITGFSKE
jgi:hypothetical protein